MLNKKVNTKIILSSSNDPWYNLALEEAILSKVEKNQVILYLWQNDNTIVIGRNQNPWKECKCKEFEESGGKLARRLSGGGAVFHDLGNLNFTFIMDKNLENLEMQLRVILDAVKKLGIDAEFSGRNDILVQGKKFSGNAFYKDGDSAYHHGTILINSNMNSLGKYLQVSKEKIESKGIDSVRSRVTNLKDIEENITVKAVVASLEESFAKIYGGNPTTEYADDTLYSINNMYDKYSSWEWRYGETPKFDISFESRFPWGGIDIRLKLHNGVIQSANVYSDAMNSKLIQDISVILEGLPFKQESISDELDNISVNEKDQIIINDLKKWLTLKIR